MKRTAVSLDALDRAKELSALITNCLPEKVEAAALTLNSKLPFKALCLRELLLHRVAELAATAVTLFEARKSVAAAVLTRSIVETVAVVYDLDRALTRFNEDKDSKTFDSFLTQALLGSKRPDSLYQAKNVLTLIGHVDKVVPGFRKSYDILSEIAHPNHSGMLGSFGQFDERTLALNLGTRERSLAFDSGTTALSGSLSMFHSLYNDMIPMLIEANSHFETLGD